MGRLHGVFGRVLRREVETAFSPVYFGSIISHAKDRVFELRIGGLKDD